MQEADPDTAATIISVAIGALAVIVGAVIAAVTAQKRLKRTLSSDRSLRDVEGLREVFDVSLQAVTRARVALDRYQTTGEFEHFATYIPARDEANGARDRLVLRLGPDEQVVRDYSDLLTAVAALGEAVSAARRAEYSELDVIELDEEDRRVLENTRAAARKKARVAREDFDRRWETYVDSARHLVAARLDIEA